MNFGDFTTRTDLQDTDQIVGHRGTISVGSVKPESRWTWAVIRSALTAIFAPASHVTNTANPHGVTKAQVGLANVDNTSDLAKPISTLAQAALATKAAVSHVSDTANPHAVTKAQIGLSNVDNTSDTAKPISTLQASAIDAKAPLNVSISSLSYAGTVPLTFVDGITAKTLTLAGNVILSASGYANGRQYIIKLTCDGTPRNFTFPAGWVFVGGEPTGMTAGKRAVLSLMCFGASEADVLAAYSSEA